MVLCPCDQSCRGALCTTFELCDKVWREGTRCHCPGPRLRRTSLQRSCPNWTCRRKGLCMSAFRFTHPSCHNESKSWPMAPPLGPFPSHQMVPRCRDPSRVSRAPVLRVGSRVDASGPRVGPRNAAPGHVPKSWAPAGSSAPHRWTSRWETLQLEVGPSPKYLQTCLGRAKVRRILRTSDRNMILE